MAYNLERLQIMLVEDNLNMRALMRSLLHTMGVRGMRDAANGEDALEQLAQFEPDILITDWVMEPMDGIELTRRIRTSEESRDVYLPIIMITGYTQEWRVLQARDAGVTEFLAKPISAMTLYQRLIAVIDKPRPFVRTSTYFGPCRRRQNWAEYVGPDRRQASVGANQDALRDMDLDDLLQSL